MNTIKNKLPIEFKDEMKELLGIEYDDFIASYDHPKTTAIRINTIKNSIDDFLKLSLFSIDPCINKIEWSEEGFYISLEENPGKNPLHDAGSYYIQEPSAMSVVGETEIRENERILDMCAAPGGKSTYILSKLNNTGLLVSNEIDKTRVKALGDNLERFGAINSIITNTSSDKLLEVFEGYFDKVFIDAPCSGQGMFRKDEYAIEDWSISKVDECVSIQKQLIRDGYKMLKNKGILIYSTCTFTKRENEDIIKDFLDDCEGARLISMDRKWPHKTKGEGHFCSRIEKQSLQDGEIIEVTTPKPKKKNKKSTKTGINILNNEEKNLFHDFLGKHIKAGCEFMKKCSEMKVIKKDNLVYLINDVDRDLSKLRIMRNGICIGEMKKNRFEPSHSLAMALKTKEVNNYINLKYDSSSIKKYISGDVIDLINIDESDIISISINGYSDTENIKSNDLKSSWVLVLIEGVSIGWSKESRGILKNKYPKGLRRYI